MSAAATGPTAFARRPSGSDARTPRIAATANIAATTTSGPAPESDNPSHPDRVPHGLRLDQRLDLPHALPGRLAAHDPLHVLGGEPLELGGRLGVGARQVERV